EYFGSLTPQLSNNWISYLPWKYSPELEFLGIITSSSTSISPCSNDVVICSFFSASPVFTKTPVPSEVSIVFSLFLSAITLPTTFQLLPVGLKFDKSFSSMSVNGKASICLISSSGTTIDSVVSFLQETKRHIANTMQ